MSGRFRFRRLLAVGVVLAIAAVMVGFAVSPSVRWSAWSVYVRLRGRETVPSRLDQFGEPVKARLLPMFSAAGVPYPPTRIVLVVIKSERKLELWAAGAGDAVPLHIRDYPVLALSGGPGPKLREGDRQVPEGVYGIESLNPNSLYHLSLRIGYPSDADRAQGALDGRGDLGGDIMIHGGAASVGCVAVGDPAIEELFVLTGLIGVERVEVVISPADPRKEKLESDMEWVRGRYALVARRLEELCGR